MSPNQFTALESPSLLLRRFHESDLETFLAYRNDPDVSRYQLWDSITRQEAADFIESQQTAQPDVPGRGFQFAVEQKGAGNLIGDCYLKIDEADPLQAEFGVSIATEHQRRGFAREAVSTVLDYVFSSLDLHRIIARTDCENDASIALLEQLGMRREGHFIQNIWFKGKWGDEYLYAILKDEWLAIQGAGW